MTVVETSLIQNYKYAMNCFLFQKLSTVKKEIHIAVTRFFPGGYALYVNEDSNSPDPKRCPYEDWFVLHVLFGYRAVFLPSKTISKI